MVKQLSSIRDIRPTAWQSTSRDLCARPSLQATRSHLSKVVRVCRAWLPRVARGLRALPRRRVGRRREATSTAPAPLPTGRHRPASTAVRNGRPPIENCVSHPERTYPANHWHPPPVVCGTTQFPITKYVPDQGPRSTGGSPACRLPTPTSRDPAQRAASPTAHSRPNRPAASTSIGIEPAKQPTAPRLLHAPPSATGPGGRYINVGASHRGPPLLGSRARTVEGSEA